MSKKVSGKIIKTLRPLLRRALMVENQIQLEQKTRWPNWLRLLRLKKLRLMIKDRIQRIISRRKIATT